MVCALVISCSNTALTSQPVHPLVRQLGDRSFERRSAAEREILNHGAPAMEWVEAGIHSPDHEIRQRSLRLMEVLRKYSFMSQRERILEDPWTISSELAPAWEVYQSFVGDSLAARNLYVRMIEQEGELMLAVALRPDHWTEDFERRCADLRMTFMVRRNTHELNPVSVLALLFLAEHPDNRLDIFSTQIISSLLVDTVFYNYVQNTTDDEAAACRALISLWVQRSGHATPQNRLELATRYQLPAGVVAAREIISNRHAAGASRTQLQNAIRFIAVYGVSDAARDLEPLLTLSGVELPVLQGISTEFIPPSQEQPGNATQDQQANDLALLGLIQVTGQNPQAYGFANTRIDLNHRHNTNVPLMTSEGDRRRALLRWYEWRTAHPKWFTPPSEDASEGVAL